MNITQVSDPFDLILIEDVYSIAEQQIMMKELELLIYSNSFSEPHETGSAKYDDGTLMKKNKAIWLDNVYTNSYRNVSPILSISENRMLSYEVKSAMKEINPCHGILFNINHHNTLISYYESSDRYDFHKDASAYTFLSYIFKEPKKFDGGDIIFRVGNEAIEIKIKNNIGIVFPSVYEHSVTEVMMNDKDLGKMNGRFCITNFTGISL